LPELHVVPVATTHVPIAIEHGLQVPQAEPAFCHVPLASQT